MKKMIFIVTILLSMFLSSCMDADLDKLKIELVPAVDTVQIFSEYLDPGATATYGSLDLETRTIYFDVDTSMVGVYEIIYRVEYEGLIKEKTRIITVVDEIAPSVSLNMGLDTILLHETWIDAGVTASDNSKVDPIIDVSGYVDSEVTGEYIITYTVSDQSGNQKTIKRFVNVVDPFEFS